MRSSLFAILCIMAGLAGASAAMAGSSFDRAKGSIGPRPTVEPPPPVVLEVRPTVDRGQIGIGHTMGNPLDEAGLRGTTPRDDAVDRVLGAVPGREPAAKEGAKHIYVTEDGELGCVTLDTFFPEPC